MQPSDRPFIQPALHQALPLRHDPARSGVGVERYLSSCYVESRDAVVKGEYGNPKKKSRTAVITAYDAATGAVTGTCFLGVCACALLRSRGATSASTQARRLGRPQLASSTALQCRTERATRSRVGALRSHLCWPASLHLCAGLRLGASTHKHTHTHMFCAETTLVPANSR